jgi:HEAT repeat protein
MFRDVLPVVALLAALFGVPCAAGQSPPPQARPPAPAAPPGKNDTQVDWIANFGEARRLARESNRPILVAFNMDHEVANDAMVKDVYTDKKFVEKSRDFVCVIGSIADHEALVDADGQSVCSRFGRITCAQHKDCEMHAREELLQGDVVIAPQHVICAADGHVLARRAWQMTRDEMLKWMEAARRRATGTVSSPAELKEENEKIRALFDQAERVRSWEKRDYVRQILDLDDQLAHDALWSYALKGKDDDLRVAIVEHFGITGDYTGIDLLRKAAKDRKPYVALAAVDAMGRTELPGLRDDLKKLLSSFSSGNDYGRVLLAYALCGKDDKEVRDLVLKKAKASDQSTRTHALVALGKMDSSPEIEACLRKASADTNTAARACAVWSIGMGRYKGCRDQLEKLSEKESVADLKDLLFAALAHLDHDPANKECCSLSGKIYRFVTLGETRR